MSPPLFQMKCFMVSGPVQDPEPGMRMKSLEHDSPIDPKKYPCCYRSISVTCTVTFGCCTCKLQIMIDTHLVHAEYLEAVPAVHFPLLLPLPLSLTLLPIQLLIGKLLYLADGEEVLGRQTIAAVEERR